MRMTKHFSIILTEERALRFAFLRKMHGFLIDRDRKKAVAVVREATKTSWPGKFARAYVIDEAHAQSVRLLSTPDAVTLSPALALEKTVQPTPDAPQAVLELTSDVLYDATDGLLVRRLGVKRMTWAQGLLLTGLGASVGFLAAALLKIWTL